MERPSIELGDETEKIFLTPDGTAEDISKEMKDFMGYTTDKKTDSDFAGHLNNTENHISKISGEKVGDDMKILSDVST